MTSNAVCFISQKHWMIMSENRDYNALIDKSDQRLHSHHLWFRSFAYLQQSCESFWYHQNISRILFKQSSGDLWSDYWFGTKVFHKIFSAAKNAHQHLWNQFSNSVPRTANNAEGFHSGLETCVGGFWGRNSCFYGFLWSLNESDIYFVN